MVLKLRRERKVRFHGKEVRGWTRNVSRPQRLYSSTGPVGRQGFENDPLEHKVNSNGRTF